MSEKYAHLLVIGCLVICSVATTVCAFYFVSNTFAYASSFLIFSTIVSVNG